MEIPDYENILKRWTALKGLRKRNKLLIAVCACVFILSAFVVLIYRKSIMEGEPTVLEEPKFLVANPKIRPGSKVIIVAENDAANLNKYLKVEYDGLVFKEGGIPIPNSNPQEWYFTLHDKELPLDIVQEGSHRLRFAFLSEDFSIVTNILISKKPSAPFIELPRLKFSEIMDPELETIEVSTARDFIKAIKPNVVIKLRKGTYNLSVAEQFDTEYVTWKKTYDGFEPLIHSVYNLTIVGESNDDTKILIQPRYAWVLSFQNSKNISIENLKIAHALDGFCTGGVLSFVDAEAIELENLILHGCGTTGIQMDNVDSFICQYTLINRCTYNLLSIYNSENILFHDCIFANSGQFNLIEIGDSTYNTKFSRCMFVNNQTSFNMHYLLEIAENTHDVSIIDSAFLNNKTQKFAKREHKLVLKDNNFSYNAFHEKEMGLNKTLINKYPLGYRLFVLVDEKPLVTCSERPLEKFSGSRFDRLGWESVKIEVGEEKIEIIIPDFSTVGLLLEKREVLIPRNIGSESLINCIPDREVVAELLYDNGKNLIVVIGLRYVAGKTHDMHSEKIIH